jgi:hypothetical protein
MRVSIFLLCALSLMGGCSEPKPTRVTVKGVTYEVPHPYVITSNAPPEGRIFVRVRSEDHSFDLILDEFTPYLPNRSGIGIPTISRINDSEFVKTLTFESSAGPIVCIDGQQPHFSCGIEIRDGHVRWGVLFDKDRVPDVERLRAEAERAIRSYRA